jgi:hypothetical protein
MIAILRQLGFNGASFDLVYPYPGIIHAKEI